MNPLPNKNDWLKDLLIELADKHFPKGDKGRGQAMVLVAESLQAIRSRIDEKLDRLKQPLYSEENEGFDSWIVDVDDFKKSLNLEDSK